MGYWNSDCKGSAVRDYDTFGEVRGVSVTEVDGGFYWVRMMGEEKSEQRGWKE